MTGRPAKRTAKHESTRAEPARTDGTTHTESTETTETTDNTETAGKENPVPTTRTTAAAKPATAPRRVSRTSAGPVRGVYIPVAPATVGRLRLLTVGPVELNLDGMAVRVAGRQVHMAPKEFELLAVLMQNAGRLLTRRQLLDAVWGEGYPDRNKTLDVHIRRLRRHLEADPEALARMRTVRGLGYVYDIGD